MSTTSQAANASTVTAAGGGIVTAGAKAAEAVTMTSWVTDNAILIGLACTVISLIMSFVFNLINRMDNKRKHREELRLKAVLEWTSEGKTKEEIQHLLKQMGLS